MLPESEVHLSAIRHLLKKAFADTNEILEKTPAITCFRTLLIALADAFSDRKDCWILAAEWAGQTREALKRSGGVREWQKALLPIRTSLDEARKEATRPDSDEDQTVNFLFEAVTGDNPIYALDMIAHHLLRRGSRRRYNRQG
jgi:hypothetical protein